MIHVWCWDAVREKPSDGSEMWVRSERDAAIEYARMVAESNDGPPIRVVVAVRSADSINAPVHRYEVNVVVKYEIA